MSSRRSCRNRPDIFCSICDESTLVPYRNRVTTFIKQTFHAYFGMKPGDQDKAWAPHMVCKSCTECLRQWSKGKKTSLKFGIPMVRREPKNHVSDCYFCAIDVTGINRKNRKVLKYPDLESARRSVAHSDECPVPVYVIFFDDSDNGSTLAQESQEDKKTDFSDDRPHPFSQNELNALVCHLNLSKLSSELLASRLKEKKLLCNGTRITFYRNRHQEFLHFFFKEKDLAYCTNNAYHLQKLEVPHYEPRDWRLFIDSCKRSFKCVLLHNGNQFASILLAHSTSLKEKYNSVKYVLEKISYCQHEWEICVDLKMMNFLWDNSLDLPSTLAFCACGIVGTDLSTIPRSTCQHEMKLCRVDPITSSTILWWTETKYSFHYCTSSLA